jgi:DNA-binding NtrC family response regulator
MQVGSTILVVDDTPNNLKVLFDFLNHAGYKVLVAENGETALEQIQQIHPDLILLDIMMPGIDGFETCRQLKKIENTRHIPVIFLTARIDTQSKIAGFEAGGVDYITKPLQHEEVLARVNTHLRIQHLQRSLENQNRILREEIEAHRRAQATVSYLNNQLKTQQPIGQVFANSKAIQSAMKIVEHVSTTDSTVLIEGEIGSGKQLFAHAIHNRSKRNGKSMVKVDCASLRDDLTENEFFGVESVSFESSGIKTIGYFELAKGGTLFLNEISELPLAFQATLLRTIHDQQNRQMNEMDADNHGIRIIASTSQNLLKAIEEGAFREDLFYWLNVIPLRVPPLRERKADIPLLLDYFFNKHRIKLGSQVTGIHENTLPKLIAYHWPGNVRELENVIERALILSEGQVLEIDENSFHYEPVKQTEQLETGKDSISGFYSQNRSESVDANKKSTAKAQLTEVETTTNPSTVIIKSDSHSDLSQDDFDLAVKSALQHFVETDSLQLSPLLFCNSVNAKVKTEANSCERIECLRALIMEATTSFTKHPKSEIYARILHRTYYQPARSQELAADALGVSYSTFRRHLVKARSWLTAELWQLEQHYKNLDSKDIG